LNTIALAPPKYEGYPNVREPKSVWYNGELVEASRFSQAIFQGICEQVAGIRDGYDLTRMWATYNELRTVFQGRFRISGEEYYQHPKAVALIDMLEFGQNDLDIIIAELMHDTQEDTLFLHGNKKSPYKPQGIREISNVDMLQVKYGYRTGSIIDSVCKPAYLIPKKQMTPAELHEYLKSAYVKVITAHPQYAQESAQVKTVDGIQNTRTEPRQDSEALDGEGWRDRTARRLILLYKFLLPISQLAGEQYYVALGEELDQKREMLTKQEKLILEPDTYIKRICDAARKELLSSSHH
jgi:hypothetical protein